MNKKEVILILGGARSGKSDTAIKLGGHYGKNVIYIAAALEGDEEMSTRIEAHRRSRPPYWKTLETGENIGDGLSAMQACADAIILDCLTMLTANIVMAQGENPLEKTLDEKIAHEIDFFLNECKKKNATCIVVSNEVGMGIVPPYKTGRLYRDVLGKANKYLASKADKVLLMIAGLAVDVKRLHVDMDDISWK
jgi:adenosylcobinamide kinase/adenosylcobinamide-phosphate guanylyltransferase